MDRVPVPEQIRELLCELAHGWAPAPMDLGQVESLWHGDVDVTSLAREVRLGANNRLSVTLGGMDLDRLLPFTSDAPWQGTLSGGVRFHADMVLSLAQSGGFSRAEGPHRTRTIEAGRWTLVEGEPPSLWVGLIDGSIDVRFSGNLIAQRVTAGSGRSGPKRHFLFNGAYRYYLVQHGARPSARWHFVIDTGGAGAPSTEALGRDFLTLQFVLGRQLAMPTIRGLRDGRTVATTLGCSTRSSLEANNFPPVPLERNDDDWIDESWAAVFFERISATWRDRLETRDTFWLPLEMYLDAMRNHLDGDYMRLQIALEAFAYGLRLHKTEAEDGRSDVKDKKAWKKWVKDNGDAVRSHAVDGREEALYNKVVAAYRFSSGKVVPTAFENNGLALTSEMVDELKGRDTVVHQGLMSPLGYDVERDIRRVALVRTMLVGLVAKVAGYSGAINGWEVGRQGYPIEPDDWWVVADEARAHARRTFVAEEIVPA